MSRWIVGTLRLVIVVVLLGALMVQLLVLPVMAADVVRVFPEAAYLRPPVLILTITGVATVEAALVCVWRLLTMAVRETVFSHRAFHLVDVIIGCACVATVLAVVQIVVLVAADAQTPGAMLGALAAMVAGLGIALLVVVLRALLAQAVQLGTEAAALHDELDEVI